MTRPIVQAAVAPTRPIIGIAPFAEQVVRILQLAGDRDQVPTGASVMLALAEVELDLRLAVGALEDDAFG